MGSAVLPIVVLSYCWCTPDHPDPDGDQLRTVAARLEKEFERQDEEGYGMVFEDMGVFWDWASLFQNKGGVPRTQQQQASFNRALFETMDMWYSHQMTIVYLVTTLPAKYANTIREYGARGWPFFESCSAELVKPKQVWQGSNSFLWEMVVDLSKIGRTTRSVPVTCRRFSALIRDKEFTNGSDTDKVAALY